MFSLQKCGAKVVLFRDMTSFFGSFLTKKGKIYVLMILFFEKVSSVHEKSLILSVKTRNALPKACVLFAHAQYGKPPDVLRTHRLNKLKYII